MTTDFHEVESTVTRPVMTIPVFPETFDSLWLDARLATMAGQTPYGILEKGALAEAGTVALLRREKVPMALSTDSNPGTSPTTSPLLMMNMACVHFGLTPAEALAGFTVNAARALGMQDQWGTLAVGQPADFAVWGIEEPAELAYRMGGNPCRLTVKEGAIVYGSS